MKRILILAALIPGVLLGAPIIISDGIDIPDPPTHCGWFFDGDPKQVEPVGIDDQGMPRCEIDIVDITEGQHIVQATFIRDKGVWGVEESPRSLPLEFTRPAPGGGGDLPAPVLRLTVSP